MNKILAAVAWAEAMGVELLLADGFDEAFVGLGFRAGETFAVYDEDRCIEILVERDCMSFEEASEHFDFNVACAYVGPGTPCFMTISDDADPEGSF